MNIKLCDKCEQYEATELESQSGKYYCLNCISEMSICGECNLILDEEENHLCDHN